MKSKLSFLHQALSQPWSSRNKWISIFLALAILTLPFQIKTLVFEAPWGRGFMNPYTSIWLSLSEVFLIISASLFSFQHFTEKKKIKYGDSIFFLLLLVGLGIAAVSIYFSPFGDPAFSFFLLVKLLSLLVFYLLLVNRVLKAHTILELFIISMSFQAVLALIQVLIQGSVGFYFLGEPHLGEQVPHIARFVFGESKIIRGYGTFSHPNILGGFLVVSLLSSLLFSPHLKYERSVLLAIQFLGLLASFSRSAMLALMFALVIISIWYLKEIKKNKIIPIALGVLFFGELSFLAVSRGFNLLQDAAVLERIEGFKLSLSIFQEYPLGVGFNHFTLFMDQVSQSPLLPWEYQPVHNVFLLALSEAGILGLMGMILAAVFIFVRTHHNRKNFLTPNRNFKKRILFVIFVALISIGLFDHYLMTLDQGRWLFIFAFAITSRFSANPRYVLPLKKGDHWKKILAGR